MTAFLDETLVDQITSNADYISFQQDLVTFSNLISTITTEFALDNGADGEYADDLREALSEMVRTLTPPMVQMMLSTIGFIEGPVPFHTAPSPATEEGWEWLQLQPLRDALLARQLEINTTLETEADDAVEFAAARLSSLSPEDIKNGTSGNERLNRAYSRLVFAKTLANQKVAAKLQAAEEEWRNSFRRMSVFLYNDGTEDKAYCFGTDVAGFNLGNEESGYSNPAIVGQNMHADMPLPASIPPGTKFGGDYSHFEVDVLNKYGLKRAAQSDVDYDQSLPAPEGVELNDVVWA